MAKISKRDAYLRRTYGITEKQYQSLLKKQDYRCAVCGKHESEEKRKLHIDHNHQTLEVRGILCGYCNLRVVGRHKTPDLLQAAADYLKRPGTGWFVPKKRKRRKKR